MGLQIKVNFPAMIEYLESVIPGDLLSHLGEIDFKDGILTEIKELIKLESDLSAILEYLRLPDTAGLTVEKVIEIGSEAIDRLIEFSGSAWGIVPVGAIVEAEDKPIVRLLLEAGYSALRGIGSSKIEDSLFEAMIREKFAK